MMMMMMMMNNSNMYICIYTPHKVFMVFGAPRII